MELTKDKLRILIADDHLLFRMGLKTLIQSEADLEVVGEAKNGKECLRLYQTMQPDLLLLDLRMPEVDGIETLTLVRKYDAQASALVLTSYGTEEEIYQAIQLGAMGFVLKDVGREELTQAIRAVCRGKKWIPPGIAVSLAERVTRQNLTVREVDILHLLVKGLMNREIASIFGVSRSTVKNQINHLFSKLEVTDRTEAATVAIQRGIVRFDA
jgi:two-component system, NarL family, response regulator